MTERPLAESAEAIRRAVAPNGENGVPLGMLPLHHARSGRITAVTFGETEMSWAALEASANRRARMLAGLGVAQGDLITVALPNGLDFYETTFALWKLGATPNVVSSKLPDHELGEIVTLVDPRLVLGPDPSRLPGRQVLPAGTPIDPSLSAEGLPEVIAPYWKAMTSGGSTGRPKVIVDHAPGLFDPGAPALMQQVGDVILNPGPLYHNAPFIGAHWGLFAGGHVIEMGRFDAGEALRALSRHKVQWVNLVPTMMNRIWRLPLEERQAADLSNLRVMFHMAASCPAWLKEAWIAWLGPERVFELYGGTERQGATVISGVEWLERKGSVGRVQAGSSVRVLRDDGSPCDPGEVGEIYFLPDAGRNATYHYIGAEAKIAGDWESLGDLGHLDSDGYLYISDRRTDLIVSGGANIYPAEVEAALEAHPEVRSAVVIGRPHEDLGQQVHAIIERSPGATVTEEALLRFVADRLVRYKTPRSLEFVDHPLRDDAGKVRRVAYRRDPSAASDPKADRR